MPEHASTSETHESITIARRVTITLPVDLDEWLDRVARSRNVPKAILIRMLLSACRERDQR